MTVILMKIKVVKNPQSGSGIQSGSGGQSGSGSGFHTKVRVRSPVRSGFQCVPFLPYKSYFYKLKQKVYEHWKLVQ